MEKQEQITATFHVDRIDGCRIHGVVRVTKSWAEGDVSGMLDEEYKTSFAIGEELVIVIPVIRAVGE